MSSIMAAFNGQKSNCLLVVVLVAILTTGCGGEYIETAGEQKAVSGNVVSGGAVSEIEASQGRYCSDTNRYTELSGQGVMQERLDGSCKKEIYFGKGFLTLISVADHWLYYAAGELEEDEKIIVRIFRVPIEKDADGYDEVKINEPEEIISSGVGLDLDGIYADEKYLFFPRWDETKYELNIVKYDLQNRREVVELTVPDGDGLLDIWRMGDQYMMYVTAGDYEVFALPLDGTELRWITDNGYILQGNIDYNDRFFFYDAFPVEGDECGLGDDAWYKFGTNIRVCDGEKDESLVTWKELREAVENVENLKMEEELTGSEVSEMYCEVNQLYCVGNRCYMQLRADWVLGGKDYAKNLVFSKEIGEKSICYEKEKSEEYQRVIEEEKLDEEDLDEEDPDEKKMG